MDTTDTIDITNQQYVEKITMEEYNIQKNEYTQNTKTIGILTNKLFFP